MYAFLFFLNHTLTWTKNRILSTFCRWFQVFSAWSQRLWYCIILMALHKPGWCYESLIIHHFSMPHCRRHIGFKWRKGNLKSLINMSKPGRKLSGGGERTPFCSSGLRSNLFKSKVMKKLIIFNEELAIHRTKKDYQRSSEETEPLSDWCVQLII